jgi:hypothetical protein
LLLLLLLLLLRSVVCCCRFARWWRLRSGLAGDLNCGTVLLLF